MAEDKPFLIPDKVLNALHECSEGGFILFTFDDQGSPKIYSDADDERNLLALNRLVSDWSKAQETINQGIIVSDLMSQLKGESRSKKR